MHNKVDDVPPVTMGPAATANAPASTQSAGRPRTARPVVVPVIPLPLVQKQQQQRQQRQQKLQKQKEEEEKKQEQERLEKDRQEKQQKEEAKRLQKEEDARQQKDKQQQHTPPLSGTAPSTDTTPADLPSSPPSSATPQTTVGTITSASSPTMKADQSSALTVAAAPVAYAADLPSMSETKKAKKPTQPSNQIVSGQPSSNVPSAPSSVGPHTTNGNDHGMVDFVFPHQRNGSSGRHRGNYPPRQAFNQPNQPHQPHQSHQPHYPSFHQTHPSSSNVTFGAFHESNSTSPVANGRAPFAPPPGLMPVPAQFIPYSAPNIGGGEWPGPPAMPLGEVNGGGYTPTGFNSSTPGGSFQGSQSPDNAADGPFGAPHVGGSFSVPVQNGSVALHNEPMPAVLSPPFYIPQGFPGSGPPHSADGHMRDSMPSHGIDVGLIHHFQQKMQHSFDAPQTADCHLFVHLSKHPRHAEHAASTSSNPSKHGTQDSAVEQDTPTIFIGHRAVLSQSYTIGELLRSDMVSAHPGPLNHPIFTAPVKIDDPFITTAAAMQALRSLYGFPVEDVAIDDTPAAPSAEVQVVDQALANLTAGFLFMLHHVELAGAEQTARAIGWSTVEKVLAYCLNGASFPNVPDRGTDPYGMPHPQAEFRYGRGAGMAIRLLLRKAVDFLVHNFPVHFAFNAANAVPVQNGLATLCRLPANAPMSSSEHSVQEQATGNGPNGHLRVAQSRGSVSLPASRTAAMSRSAAAHEKRDSRASNIVFGDFDAKVQGTRPAQGTAENPTGATAVLSRVLVELPFSYLKYVLEHPNLGVAQAAREAVARDVVAERETRRKQGLDDLRAGRIVLSASERDAVLGRVLYSEAPPVQRDYPVDCWDVLGWRELCLTEGSELVRAWGQPEVVVQ